MSSTIVNLLEFSNLGEFFSFDRETKGHGKRNTQNDSLKRLESVPYSDLHNHVGRGGSITYTEQLANVKRQELFLITQLLFNIQGA